MRRKTIIARQSIYHSELTNKLIHMIRFIEQEGKEKADEIECQTEEEFNILKGGFIQTERLKIMKEYDNKEMMCKRENQIQTGKTIYQLKMTEVDEKLKIFSEISEEIRQKIAKDLGCAKRRWNILQHLIIESLFKLLEKEVVIKCRKLDVKVIEKSLPDIEAFYEETTGKQVKLSVDNMYLPDDALPGVIMHTPNNKISLKNTLDDRLDQIMRSSLPVMNQIFFGTSKMRK